MRKIGFPVLIILVLASAFIWEQLRVHHQKFSALDHAAAELHAAQSLGMVQVEHMTLLRDVFAEYDVLERDKLNNAEQKALLGYPSAIEVCRNARVVWSGFEIVPLPFEGKHHLYRVKKEALDSLSIIGVPEIPPKLFVTEDGQEAIVQTALGTCDTALEMARNGGTQAQVRSALRPAIADALVKLRNVFTICWDAGHIVVSRLRERLS
jgi:hypothetical protein